MEHETEEIWAEIQGTDGRYSISSLGRLRSNWADIPQKNLRKRMRIEKQKILKPVIHTTGYLRASLGRQSSKYIHRLVAQAFVPNPENLAQVDHIDGIRTNNSASNLRWVSPRDNSIFGGERHGWISQKIANAKRRIHEARRSEYQSLVEAGYSYRKIAKMFGTSHTSIRAGLSPYKDPIAEKS
jgi:hypothetical protein